MTIRTNASPALLPSPEIVAGYVHPDFHRLPSNYSEYTRVYVPELQAHVDFLVSRIGAVNALEVADHLGTGLRDWIVRFGNRPL